jgi:pyrroline-5-carboxylate reductase
MADLSNATLGFLGCGKISSAVCRGYAGASGNARPKKILVSLRNEAKSSALKAAFPDLVHVVESNEALVAEADVVFIGLLPAVARELLPTMPFTADKLVISMMAAVDLQETLALTKMPADRLVRTVPLPSAAIRSGPVLVHPPNAAIEAILAIVSTPAVCTLESHMKPMIAVTGHISSFFELMKTSQEFVVEQGKHHPCLHRVGCVGTLMSNPAT